MMYKRKMKGYILLLLICFLTIMLMFLGCQSRTKLDVYEYPITPGTDEWKNLNGHEGMVEACQIPSDILKRLSTAGLVETILNYPLIFEINVHNFPQDGIDTVTNQFNGLQELFNRQDNAVKLLEIYSSMNLVSASKSLSEQELLGYYYKIDYMEMFITQQPVLSKFDAIQIKELISECLVKVTQKQKVDISAFGISTTTWLISRALKQAAYEPFMKVLDEDSELQNFIATGSIYDKCDEIIGLANRFLAENQ